METANKEKYKKEEYLRGPALHAAYLRSLETIFDFSIINSFLDLKNNETISGSYDLVSCFDFVNHLESETKETLIMRILAATKDILIITEHKNDNSIIDKISKNNFTYWKECSEDLQARFVGNLSQINLSIDRKIMIFKRNRFAKINSSYLIQGISTDNSSHKLRLTKPGLTPVYLQKRFKKLTKIIREKVLLGKSFSFLRLGDGDYFFLRKIGYGSAEPGRRALTKNYDEININLFRSLLWQNDIISLSLEKHDQNSWVKFIFIEFAEKILQKISKKISFNFKNVKLTRAFDIGLNVISFVWPISWLAAKIYSVKKGSRYFEKASQIINKSYLPLETIYALVSTKWIFKNYKNEIGIIASAEKNSVIKELMKHSEYRNYLGIDNFTEYIDVPAKGAADDIINLSKEIGEKIKKSNTKIFLIGVGSSKIALMPLLKNYSNAVFIDVGCGIDAIAGIVCQDRPYFAEWINYRMKNYDYSKIDFIDKGNPAWNNPNYKTIYL